MGPRRSKPAAAFTLVETIAAMAILALVAAVSTTLVWSGIRSFRDGSELARSQSEISVVVERLARELRAIPLDADDTPDLARIDADRIDWSGGAKSVALSGSNLVFTDATGAHVLLSGVTSFSLEAYDASNAAVATPLAGAACDPVRRIRITISATRGSASCTVRTKVFLRCMMMEFAA